MFITLFILCLLKVKEWLQNLGLVDHPPVIHDDDEGDDVAEAFHHNENSVKNRYGKLYPVECWYIKPASVKNFIIPYTFQCPQI